MTKKQRVLKSWERNWDLYKVKGVYFNMGNLWKDWLSPKQVLRMLRKEDRIHQQEFKKWKRKQKTQ